jgi:hypothetical protein
MHKGGKSSNRRSSADEGSGNKEGSEPRESCGSPANGCLRCDGCGEEFVIGHQPAFVDKRIAEKQAVWLEKVLAEEHERDKKHPDRIELPD